MFRTELGALEGGFGEVVEEGEGGGGVFAGGFGGRWSSLGLLDC